MNDELAIQSEVESLRGRFPETKGLYREVCALLFFRYGITPTTNKLYQLVRKGSMSAPAEALAAFWQELRSKARVEIDHPDLPVEIKAAAAEAIAALWTQATAAARTELAAIRAELQAGQEQLQRDRAQSQQAAAQALETVEQLRRELAAALEATARIRSELAVERQMHAGAVARWEDQQVQIQQARAQQQAMQESFSADLTKAREAVSTADQRAGAAEKRALLTIEHERQSRAKSEKQVELLRAQVSQAESRERQAVLAQAEAVARAQSKGEAALITERVLQQAHQTLEQDLRTLREQLQVSQQEVMRFRTEAQTVQVVLERLTAPTAIKQGKLTKKRAST